MEKTSSATITEMESPLHKVPIEALGLPARWIIWAEARKVGGEIWDTERVCIGRVTDDDESNDMPLRHRSLLVKEFFSDLVGCTIAHKTAHSESYHGTWYEAVCEETLPESRHRLCTFSDILEWFEQNQPKCLADDCALLREKQKAAKARTRLENAERRARQADAEQQRQLAWAAEEERRRVAHDQELAEKRTHAPHFAFVWGYNKKYSRGQWQAQCDGVLYVLAFGYQYTASEGSVPVEMVRHLVLGKIVLVRRI